MMIIYFRLFGPMKLCAGLLLVLVLLGRCTWSASWLATWKPKRQDCLVIRHGSEDVSKRLARASTPRVRETKEAADEGSISGAVGGAVLGGLLLGPFGAIFGANLGSEWGRRGGSRIEQDIDEDIVKLAQLAGRELADAMDSKMRVEEIKDSLAAKVVRLDTEVEELTSRASEALKADDEAAARLFLEKKYPVQQSLESSKRKLEDTLMRVSTINANVEKLEKQALAISSLLERAQEATGAERTALKAEASAFSVKDPLLDKFDRL